MALNEGWVYRTQIGAAEAGAEVLAHHESRFPRSNGESWREAIEAGRVLVNGRAAVPGLVLRAGDHVEFHRPPWDEPDAPAEFRVLHEDEHVLAVAKPSGLQVLPAGPFTARTLFHLVRASEPSRSDASPVHRLGRGTSGLVLFGKTALARARLSAQFRDLSVRKTYLALVRGAELADSCIARHPIGTRAHGPLVIACADPAGKPAKTRVRVLLREGRVAACGAARARAARPIASALDGTLVAAQPITGRGDQIRIHLAALGAPIVGDPLYGPGGVPCSDAPPGRGGYFLHATAIRFRHPITSVLVQLRSWPAWIASDAPRRGGTGTETG